MVLLSLFLIPLIASLGLFFLSGLAAKRLKGLAFFLSLIPLVLLVLGTSNWIGKQVDFIWFDALSIHFHLYVDHLTLVFLYLVSIIVPLSILAETRSDLERPHFFYGLILLVQALLIGFFASKDLLFFIFFFEAILVPLYFLLTIWGGKGRKRAAFTFIVYMIAGSSLMLVSVLALYLGAENPTFNMGLLAKTAQGHSMAPLLCALFLLAFFVKTPLFPFHAWLADTYCQASTTATILLAALLSKAGIYGILRIGIGLFPNIIASWSTPLVIVAIVGMLYGAFAAWAQTDFKRLIAYSSFSHVNFILAGIFAASQIAVGGAILQAVNHAVTITGLFLVVGWLEARIQTTTYLGVSGLAAIMPRLCWLTLFFVLSAVAIPGLNNFVSEIMVLYGLFVRSWWLSALLALTMIFSILYMLRWMQSIYFAKCSVVTAITDIRAKEMLYSLPLVALIFWLGMYPGPVLKQIEPAAKKLSASMETRL